MKVDQVLEKINLSRRSQGERPLELSELATEELSEIVKIATESEAKELTIEAVKDHIKTMRKVVENELTNEKMERFSLWSFIFNFKKDYGMKARLRNYMLLEELLMSPENIRKHAEQQLGAMVGGK